MNEQEPNEQEPLDDPHPITLLQLAEFRLNRPAETGADFQAAGVPMVGGCQGCHACIAAYNAYPSKTGFLRCDDCIGDLGWDTVEEANAAIFGAVTP